MPCIFNLPDLGKYYLDISNIYQISYTQLNYSFVNLDNNNRFQDRELKSIKIQADCEYIRLVMKGCHGNRLNIHKQVKTRDNADPCNII